MQELKIEYVPIEDIKPYDRNAKIHDETQIEMIAESIKQFGFNDPIAVSNGIIVEGHGRLLAAEKLGLDTLPVICLDSLTDEQRKAYTLVHNKLNMNTGFDLEILTTELEEIEIDMEQFGFEPVFSIDGIEEISGFDEEKEKSDFFEKAFTFPRDKKKQIISYLSKHQQEITERIVTEAVNSYD